MRLMRLIPVVALFALMANVAGAQIQGPQGGSWGAEGSTGSTASLLRFRSANTAWLIGVNASYVRLVSESFNPITGVVSEETDENWQAQLRLGHRWYSSNQSQLRRFSSIGGIIGYSDGLIYGAFGDIGAAWFFSPHVSLGTSAELLANRIRRDVGSGTGVSLESIAVQVTGFKLLGAVYF